MTFKFSKQALKALARLNAAQKARIRQGIEGIPQGDIKPMRGLPGVYRLRVGDWRILFSYSAQNAVLVEKIAPRGDAYKGGL